MDCLTIDVARKGGEAWGVQISGEAPCYIQHIAKGSPVEEAGLAVGDYLISINGVSVFDASHEHVVGLIAKSGKIARFRILPGGGDKPSDTNSLKYAKPTEAEISQSSSSRIQFREYDASESDDDEYFFEFRKKDDRKAASVKEKSYDIQVHYEKDDDLSSREQPVKKGEILLEQSSFIVTQEDQKRFDEQYQLEGNFAGRRATVAGAFTGDFNVIRSPKEDGDVIGVKSRVLAGIQHFSLSDKNAMSDTGRIILFTTSLGINRSVAYKCQEAKKILRGFRVKFAEKDIFNEPQFKDELFERLGISKDHKKLPDLPLLFIDGIFSGGYEGIVEMSDCGDLRIRLQDFPKYSIRQHCSTCKGEGIIACRSCGGKGSRKSNRFTTLKCGTCQQKGETACPDCL